MKQPIRQPKMSRKAAKNARAVRGRRNSERNQRSSLDALIRLDKSAIISMILLYCVIHWAIRVFVAPIYTVEEADQLLLSEWPDASRDVCEGVKGAASIEALRKRGGLQAEAPESSVPKT